MDCPACGFINSPNNAQCRRCGHEFKKPAKYRRRILGFDPPSLWFAWLIVTACDLVTIYGTGYTDRWNYFPNAIFNLFTPILFGNVSIVTVPLLVVGLFAGDWLGKHIKPTGLRVVYNLLFLLGITTAMDEIKWGSPQSIEHILDAYHCVAIKPKPPWCVTTPGR